MPNPPELAAFTALGLSAELSAAMFALGHTEPTQVQVAAIPQVLAGRDVKARAQTGTGKTLAFGLPLLQQLVHKPRPRSAQGNPVQVLVLVPTRELAIQVADVLSGLVRELPLTQSQVPPKVLAVFGGVSTNPQMMDLRGGVDILVATPGRLLDLQRRNAVELTSLRALVLDEADRMLSLGFSDELNAVLELLPTERQSLLFSATFPPQVQPLAAALLTDPVELTLGTEVTPALVEQHVYTVDSSKKRALLTHLIQTRGLEQVLVFVGAKKTADRLAQKLLAQKILAAPFHGGLSQQQRTYALEDFTAGHLQVLVATDLAARGIDIEKLPVVVNYELPRSPNDYAHRIGRTGRAGKAGLAISLICPEEYHHFRVIEKRIKQRIPREQVPGFEITPESSLP
jgi:superfamily II DNA/RNA helicase